MTEAALEDTALTLLKRDGVLAGLNLREVADQAQVNRGLVYQYFGSRGELLRRALLRRGEHNRAELAAANYLPLPKRWTSRFRAMVSRPELVELTTLLLLDGTTQVKTMPLRESTLEHYRRDVEEANLAPDVDIEALNAVMAAFLYGYTLYRGAFAKEMGTSVDDLDNRVEELLYGRLYRAIKPPDKQETVRPGSAPTKRSRPSR